MMRRTLATMLGVAAVAAVMTTGYVQAQDQSGAPAPPPHGRRGPGGPGGPGGFFGFGGPGGPGGPGFGGALGLLRQLDLNEAQRAQVRQIMDGHRDELTAIGERLRAAHQAENEAVTAAQFDEQLVRAKAADLAAVQADASVLQAKVHSDVFAVLTPEQQAKAAELKAQRQARAEQFRQQVRERVKERRQRATPPAQ